MDLNFHNIKFRNLSYSVQTWQTPGAHAREKSECVRRKVNIVQKRELSSFQLCQNISMLTLDGKFILRNLNGEFQRHRVSAIVGQSGSGKTSLIRLLTGYTRKNVTGSIVIEGLENARDMRRQLKYIMQDSTLHCYITVREAMEFASNLKLNSVSNTCRSFKVSENAN